ncbi:MAG: type I restriction enzyme endonuclease domain-containing protein [Opitutaceae bacterium]
MDDLFNELINLSRSLTDEQQRHVRENLTEEELTVFDILTRPDPELTESERAIVKKVTHQLLDRIQQVLALDWRKQAAGRARVQEAINDVLDQGLPEAYTRQICLKKCALLFEHIYENRTA